MEQLMKLLVDRLARKGMEVTSIPAYIRNFAHTLMAHPTMNLEELNGHLQRLGWDDFALDNDSFYLILAAFEPDLALEPVSWLDASYDLEDLPKSNGERQKVTTLQGDSNKPVEE